MKESQTTAEPRRRGRRIWTAALALTMILGLALLAQAAPLAAPPLPSPQYAGPGAFCVADTGVSPLNCTANDTRISQLTPTITDVCLTVGDTATVTFSATLVIGASTRYDLAMYIATDGGSAENGSSCYKDVLQPVAELNAAGDPTNPLGTGPFKNEDDDSCGEANQTVGAFYQLQQALTITCVDEDNDGVVDPISTCLSWANNAGQYTCTGVTATMPGPGTGSKCNCELTAPNPPILFYEGYDWGDLPDSYGTLTASGGAQHAIQDNDNNNVPNTQGGVAAVWLGPLVDYSPNAETDGQPSPDALGDDKNIQNGKLVDDEDGVTAVPEWSFASGGTFTVQVNSSTLDCTGCNLGFWIDWNNDGDFGDPGESYVNNPVVYGSNTVTFAIPPLGVMPASVYARFRLYDPARALQTIAPTGLVVNGEVEDYWFDLKPLAVTLESFTAQATSTGVSLAWVTVSDISTRGFNLYRAESEAGPRTQLNAALIPVAALGSAEGHDYAWTDTTAASGHTYWYQLDDVSLSGAVTSHPPVMVVVSAPTSVRLVGLGASSALGTALPLAAIGFVLLAGFALVRRQRR